MSPYDLAVLLPVLYSRKTLTYMLQEMSSKTVIVCNRKAWETLQMVKLIMVTSYNTTAYLPIVRERVRNIPGGHCAALQDSSEGAPLCFRPLLRQRRPLGRLHHSLASFPLSSKVHPTLPGYHLESTSQHTPYELICDSEFAAQGSLLRPSLTSLTLLL